ncbi:MAG: DUF4013 domain-containing protein [Thermomicrobium sp.]|nr:DUF4013 domain-containing protein [Thermomicrobium sp.]MDW7982244.1 DUF4013 domain-containing protein [Thermomicrobium sp.]
MDIGRAFTYPFQDSEWLHKALIALVMLLIPIIGWLIVFGYIMRIIRQIALGSDVPLPEWDDFAGDLARGFKFFVISLIWAIPFYLLAGCFQIPGVLLQTQAGSDLAEDPLFVVLSLCGYCVAWLIGQVLTFIAPLFVTRFAVADRFGAAFALRDIVRELPRGIVDLLLIFLLSWGLSVAVAFSLLLCIVGILPAMLYYQFVTAHLQGQFRRRLDASGATASTPSPVVSS